jgi:hypothetical protein
MGLGCRADCNWSIHAIAPNPKDDQFVAYFTNPRYDGRIGRSVFPVSFWGPKSARENGAKRNEGQPIENKRLSEIDDSAPSMISKTCDPCRETFHFAKRNEALRCRCFGLIAARNETGRVHDDKMGQLSGRSPARRKLRPHPEGEAKPRVSKDDSECTRQAPRDRSSRPLRGASE